MRVPTGNPAVAITSGVPLLTRTLGTWLRRSPTKLGVLFAPKCRDNGRDRRLRVVEAHVAPPRIRRGVGCQPDRYGMLTFVARRRGTTGTSMGGKVISVRRGKDPARTGKCPKCGAFDGERCFNVDSGGGKAGAQDWTHPERLKVNGLPRNATRTKPRTLGPHPNAEARAAERREAAERRRPRSQPWEYGQQAGAVRRRVDNG